MGDPVELGLVVAAGALLALVLYALRFARLARLSDEVDDSDRASLKRESMAVFGIAVVLYLAARQLGVS